jgi:CxxC-x17-CxxC domain-containing protein
MELVDKTIHCVECDKYFVHSADDQRRFQERGFANEPRRCPECREKRRQAAAAKAAAAKPEAAAETQTFAPPPKPRPKQPPGGPPRPRPYVPQSRGGQLLGGGGRDRGPRQGGFGDRRGQGPPRESYDIVCADCGAQTTVPFKPAGNRPVYCRACYRNRKPAGEREPGPRDYNRGGGSSGPVDDD